MTDTTKNTNEAAVVADLDLPPLPSLPHPFAYMSRFGDDLTDAFCGSQVKTFATDYARAAVVAALARSAAPASAASLPDVAMPGGFALVPLYPNAEMIRVMADEEWKWEDLLAAAEAITEQQYNDIAAQPAEGSAQVAKTGKVHELKTDSEVFVAVIEGRKTYEIRFNDRGFAVGDTLLLRETVSTGKQMKFGAPLEFTGRATTRIVSHILTGYGLEDGWCLLSFAGMQMAAPERSDTPAAIVRAAAPATWEEYQRIADLPDIHEALQGYADDPTGDNGTMIVRAILARIDGDKQGAQGDA